MHSRALRQSVFLNAVVPLSISFYLPLLFFVFFSRKRRCGSSRCGHALCGALCCSVACPVHVRGSKKRLIVDKTEKGFCDWIPMKGSWVVCSLLCSADKRIQPIVVGWLLITVWTDSMGLCLPWEYVLSKESKVRPGVSLLIPISLFPSVLSPLLSPSWTHSCMQKAHSHTHTHTPASFMHPHYVMSGVR